MTNCRPFAPNDPPDDICSLPLIMDLDPSSTTTCFTPTQPCSPTAMMLHSSYVQSSPPNLAAFTSSKSSSLSRPCLSDEDPLFANLAHFEDIGLEDDHDHASPTFYHALADPSPVGSFRALPSLGLLKPTARSMSSAPTQTRNNRPLSRCEPSSPADCAPQPPDRYAYVHSSRSTSPSISVKSPISRPFTWQIDRRRKSTADLERECDDDSEDEIPPNLVLHNVPISPPPTTNQISHSAGTPIAHMLISPPAPDCCPASPPPNDVDTIAIVPVGIQDCAIADLTPETRALNEKLGEHASGLKTSDVAVRSLHLNRPKTWTLLPQPRYFSRRSLPPYSSTTSDLIQTNVVIDPLPVSKQKAAALSRTRPSWLPPKDPSDERRHLRQYRKMLAYSVEMAHRREAERAARIALRGSATDRSIYAWEHDILPRWTDAIYEASTRQQWWQGIPSRIRASVWPRAIGNPLGLSAISYGAALQRARRARGAPDALSASWLAAIYRDISKDTWPELRIFQLGGRLHESLVNVLFAHAMYRSNIGYVTGSHTVAALLLLNLPSPTATFIALANILNRTIPLAFYSSDSAGEALAYKLVLDTLRTQSPILHTHLTSPTAESSDPNPGDYLCHPFRSLLTTQLAIDQSIRLWDVYVFEGDAVLVRAIVALLLAREMDLLAARTPSELSRVLAAPPRRGRLVGEPGAEDRWMDAVRSIGS